MTTDDKLGRDLGASLNEMKPRIQMAFKRAEELHKKTVEQGGPSIDHMNMSKLLLGGSQIRGKSFDLALARYAASLFDIQHIKRLDEMMEGRALSVLATGGDSKELGKMLFCAMIQHQTFADALYRGIHEYLRDWMRHADEELPWRRFFDLVIDFTMLTWFMAQTSAWSDERCGEIFQMLIDIPDKFSEQTWIEAQKDMGDKKEEVMEALRELHSHHIAAVKVMRPDQGD